MARCGLIEEELTRAVIGAFFEVYNTLGFGFLESVYVAAMERELAGLGLQVSTHVSYRVMYKGEPIATHRMDMVVEGRVVLELKSTTLLHPSALRQLQNYLKGTNIEVGLLLHFGPRPKFYRQVLSNIRKTEIADDADHADQKRD